MHAKRLPALAVLACIWGILQGCAPSQQATLHVDPQDFRNHNKVVCVEDLQAEMLPQGDPRIAEMRARLLARLRQAGLSPVDFGDNSKRWGDAVASVHGIYDPITGVIRTDRFRVARRAYFAAAQQMGCDVVLSAEVQIVAAPVGDSEVQWDGSRALLQGDGGLVTHFGHIEALSLWLVVRNLDDRELYFSAGGIQPLMFVAAGRPVRIGSGAILADAERNQLAIDLALHELFPDQPLTDLGPLGRRRELIE